MSDAPIRPADAARLAEACRAVAHGFGIALDERRTAAIVESMLAALPGLLRMRAQALDFGAFAIEPAAAQRWIEEAGSGRRDL